MWFYPLLFVLVILGIAGGTLLGGIYTIVLVPLAVIAVISALVYALWARSLEAGDGTASTEGPGTSERPLPSQHRRPTGRVRTTPERLVDARRQRQ